MKIIVPLFLTLVVLPFYFTISFSLEARGHNLSGHSHTETPSSMSSVSEMDELMNALELGDRVSFFIKSVEFRRSRLSLDSSVSHILLKVNSYLNCFWGFRGTTRHRVHLMSYT